MGERGIPDPDLYKRIDVDIASEDAKNEFFSRLSSQQNASLNNDFGNLLESEIEETEEIEDQVLAKETFEAFLEKIENSKNSLDQIKTQIILLRKGESKRRQELEAAYKEGEKELEYSLFQSALSLRNKFEETREFQYADRFNKIANLWKDCFREDLPIDRSIIEGKK